MVKTQEEILALILERVEDNPDKDVDEVVAEVYKEMGLSQEEYQKAYDDYKESAKLIDGYTENLNEIRESKKKGRTVKEWFMDKYDKLTSLLRPEQKKELDEKLVKEMGEDIWNEVESSDSSVIEEKQTESIEGKEECHGITE